MRDHARIYTSINTDTDFLALSCLAKLTYLQLTLQPKLTYAGTLDLAARRWSRFHPDHDADEVRAALAELHAARFVIIDYDTEELLIRSFLRVDKIYRQPNLMKSALRAAFQVESPILRAALAAELRRDPVTTCRAAEMAAAALEAGVRTVPAAILAATSRRDQPATTPAHEPTSAQAGADTSTPDDGAPKPSANPSAKGSRPARGEGGRGLGEGSRLPVREAQEVGVRAPAHVSAHAPACETEPTTGTESDAGSGSVRQRRRELAEYLVSTYTPQQPKRVLQALTGEVIGLLREGTDSAAIAAGLRLWAGKSLSVRLLPELVGEHMRRDLPREPDKLRAEADTVAMFEALRADYLERDESSPLAEAVTADVGEHVEPAALGELMREAGQRTLAGAAA